MTFKIKLVCKILFVILVCTSGLNAQVPIPCRYIDSASSVKIKESLLSKFGTNKFFIPQFRLQCLIALSYYPSLKDVHIDFVFSDITTTMQCRPTIHSIIQNLPQKEYIIYINNNKNFEGVLLENVPFNAQIGVIGHELAHIIDYEDKNTIGVINRGLDYLSDKKKKEYEQFIDSLTIKNGLGWQLYDWADFVLNKSHASNEYKDFKRNTYLTPEKIKSYIFKEEIYNNCR